MRAGSSRFSGLIAFTAKRGRGEAAVDLAVSELAVWNEVILRVGRPGVTRQQVDRLGGSHNRQTANRLQGLEHALKTWTSPNR